MPFHPRESSITGSVIREWGDLTHIARLALNTSKQSPSRLRPASSRSQTLQPDERLREQSAGIMQHEINPTVEGDEKNVVIGIDYGTTFTSAAYYVGRVKDQKPDVRNSDIKTIRNWPGDPDGTAEQVPTETWYSLTPMKRLPIKDQFDDESEGDQQHVATQPSGNSNFGFDDEQADADGDFEMDGLDTDESSEFLWGFHVPYQMYVANTTRNQMRHIDKAKLMLVDAPYTEKGGRKNNLRRKVNQLIAKGLIRKYGKRKQNDVRDIRDIITDFLVKVLHHVRDQLVAFEGFTDEWRVEFVITEPTAWTKKSSRIMLACMEAATKAAGFGILGNGTPHTLFLIPEPEAAATYMLGHALRVLVGENVLVLDCGGGTVDAVTYKIRTSFPLRLGSEVIAPDGDACGGTYLNENFKTHLLERLKDEHYLERTGESREMIVNQHLPHFEKYVKRKADPSKNLTTRIRIVGLVGDKDRGRVGEARKRFENNHLLLNPQDYSDIFNPVLEKVRTVLEQQLRDAFEKGEAVKTVFLIGGFGAAPSLRTYLRQFLQAITEYYELPYTIRLIEDSQKCVTAVAAGAVMRALDKENGPKRFLESSFGFLRKEPYQPTKFPDHARGRPKLDEVDGENYVLVLDYFMIKTHRILQKCTFGPFKSFHTFEIDKEEFLCEEILYLSDEATESHCPLNKGKNKNAEIAGRIIVDMTYLKKEGKLVPVMPETDMDGIVRGVPHYRIELELYVSVVMRNLHWGAKYPANKNGKIQEENQVSITAAFKAGTT